MEGECLVWWKSFYLFIEQSLECLDCRKASIAKNYIFMISSIGVYVKRFYRQALGSMAFWPSIISIGFLLLGIVLLGAQGSAVLTGVNDRLGSLAIAYPDTARSLLSILTGGLISLMVFSFSMVMVVLSQASAQFSPRILPGLISNRYHQFVLGIYLGSIIYNLTVLVQIMPNDSEIPVPPLAIILSLVFGVFCLGLFVAFIHSISNAVRIDNILHQLFKDTERAMNQQLKEKEETSAIGDESWYDIKSNQSGYLFNISNKELCQKAQEKDVVISMSVPLGSFVLAGTPILQLNRPTDDDDLDWISPFLTFSFEETISEDYTHGLKQITEIAVKAMSPGINDPITAIKAIDYLTALWERRIRLAEHWQLKDADGAVRIYLKKERFQSLIHACFAPMRNYFCQDTLVYTRVIQLAIALIQHDSIQPEQRKVLLAELDKLWQDAQEGIQNSEDLAAIQSLVESMAEKR